MAQVGKIQAVLSGWNGGPGVNSWYFQAVGGLGPDAGMVDDFAAQIRAVYAALIDFIPSGVHIDIDPICSVFEVGTGNLAAVHGTGTHTRVSGRAAGTSNRASRATQFNVRLATDRIVGNRILAGRHFIGPISNNAMNESGQIADDAKGYIRDAYEGVLDIAGLARLVVWSQPKPERTGTTGKPLPAQEGVTGYVQSAEVMPIPGTLRSRKH